MLLSFFIQDWPCIDYYLFNIRSVLNAPLSTLAFTTPYATLDVHWLPPILRWMCTDYSLRNIWCTLITTYSTLDGHSFLLVWHRFFCWPSIGVFVLVPYLLLIAYRSFVIIFRCTVHCYGVCVVRTLWRFVSFAILSKDTSFQVILITRAQPCRWS